jgi:hypothetical protein
VINVIDIIDDFDSFGMFGIELQYLVIVSEGAGRHWGSEAVVRGGRFGSRSNESIKNSRTRRSFFRLSIIARCGSGLASVVTRGAVAPEIVSVRLNSVPRTSEMAIRRPNPSAINFLLPEAQSCFGALSTAADSLRDSMTGASLACSAVAIGGPS